MHYDEYNRKDRITSAGKNVRKPKPCNAARGNAKWRGCFGKWSGDSSIGQTQSYPMTQQVRPRCTPHEMKTAKVEASQMPTRWGISRDICVCVKRASNENEWSTDASCNMDEPWQLYAELKKPVSYGRPQNVRLHLHEPSTTGTLGPRALGGNSSMRSLPGWWKCPRIDGGDGCKAL